MKVNLSIFWLKAITIFYFAIPVILFFITYLHWYIGLPLALLLSLLSIFYIKNQPKGQFLVSVFQFGFLTIVGSIWIFLSGIGAFGMPARDLLKAKSIFKALIEQPFPVSYMVNGSNIYLCTYLGHYFTVPVLFGWLPWPFVAFIITIWSCIGVIIGIFWFCKIVGSFSPLIVLLFVFISGVDIAGQFYNSGFTETFQLLTGNFFNQQPFFGIMTDPKMMQLYQSNAHTIFWGPQHAMAAWGIGGMFLYELFIEKNISRSVIYLVVLPFWSPFILVGLLPFFLLGFYQQKIKSFFNWQNFAAIPVFLILVWYISSIPVSDLDKGIIFYKPERLLGYANQLFSYSFFLFFEVGIWLLPSYFIFKKYLKNDETKLLIFVGLVLLILPVYKFGKYNDWSQRVALPALFIVWVLVARAFLLVKKDFYAKFIFFILFIFGSWDPLYYFLWSLNGTNYTIKYTAIPLAKIKPLPQTCIENEWPIIQFLAKDDATFFKYLVKK